MAVLHAKTLRPMLLAAGVGLVTLLRADEAQEVFDKGQSLLTAADDAGARAAFERLIEKYPHSECVPTAHFKLAQLLVATQPRAAAGHYAAVAGVEKHPLAEPAAFGCGEALYRAADWKGAAEAYATVLARYPDGKYAAQALYSRGWALFQAGEFEGALREFRSFEQKYPEHALAVECRLKAGDALRQLKRFDEALQSYEQVRAAGGRFVPDALAGKAWVLYAQRDFIGAQGAFHAAAQSLGQDARAAANLFNAGNAAIEARQYPAAVERFGQVQQGWPTNALAHAAAYWQALALFRLDRTDEAEVKLEWLREVGVPAELTAEVTVLQAEVQEARHKYAEAAALYASVVTNFPEHALAATAAAGGVVALEKAGQLSEAEVAASAFVQRYPASEQRPAVQFLIGEYRYRLGKYAEAVPELERFVTAYPAHELAAAALLKAGWCDWNLKQMSLAHERFARVVSDYGKSPLAADAAFMKGRTAEEIGDAAAAYAGYGEAVRLGQNGDTAQRAAVELVRLDHAAKRYEAALTRADAFLAAHTAGASLPRARLYRAEALLELGRLPEALEAYRKVGEADPVTAAGAAYGAAWVLRRQGRHPEAGEAFAKVAAGHSTYAADALFWAARSQEEAGHLEAASATYGTCLGQTPPNPHADEAAYRQAYCLWQTRKPDDAERLYDAVISERTDSPFAANALYDLAWVMLEQGKKPEARQRFEEFARKYPKHLLAPDAHFRVGELAYEAEAFTTAATNYETAAAAEVAFRDKALYKLGWAREKLAQNEAAAQTFLRLARQFPKSEYAAEAQYRAGVLLQGLGRFDEARAALAAASADGPFAERAACGVAECWHAAGRHTEAAAVYAQVLDKWPHGECRVSARLGRAGELRAGGAVADAIAEYAEAGKGGETHDAALAMLGQGHCWFALKKWEDAARCFLKVDVLFDFEDLKPEALAMAARSWEQAGDMEKATVYREDLKKRYPKSKEAQGL